MDNEKKFTIECELIGKSDSKSKIEKVSLNGCSYVLKTSDYLIHNEFQALSLLSSPNIIAVMKKLSDYSYVMEYCPKGDFEHQELSFNRTETVHIFKQMCEAVKCLHSRNVAHLDLKPSNFLESEDGKVKLIDFGHAQMASRQITSPYGTSRYNSPERYQGPFNALKADIYSLGICLIYLISGISPFRAPDKSSAFYQLYRSNEEKFWDKIDELASRKSAKFDGLDLEAIELIRLMLSEDPNKRPSIAQVLSHNFFKL